MMRDGRVAYMDISWLLTCWKVKVQSITNQSRMLPSVKQSIICHLLCFVGWLKLLTFKSYVSKKSTLNGEHSPQSTQLNRFTHFTPSIHLTEKAWFHLDMLAHFKDSHNVLSSSKCTKWLIYSSLGVGVLMAQRFIWRRTKPWDLWTGGQWQALCARQTLISRRRNNLKSMGSVGGIQP